MSTWKTRLFRRLDSAHVRFNERIKDRWPRLSVWLYHKPRAHFIHYRVERALLKGRDLKVNQRQSIVLFTVNKAASMYVHKVLMRLTKPQGLVPVDYTAWTSGVSGRSYRIFNDPAALRNMFRPQGFFFGALRDFCAIPEPEKYRIVVTLRDPRDVLTSKYYSQAFSHSVINTSVLERREKVLRQTVDEFVLEHAPGLFESYQQYLAHYANKPYALITTYEKMTTDHDAWLQEMIDFTGLGGNTDVIEAIKTDARKVKGSGDKSQHIRVAKSGDHVNKLKPATVAELDRLFAPMLPWFEVPANLSAEGRATTTAQA